METQPTKASRAKPPQRAKNPITTTSTATLTEPADLLREIAIDKQKIKQLNGAKARIKSAINTVEKRIGINQAVLLEPYEPTTPLPEVETFKQLELF